jgi:hypothetical protein
MSESYDHTIVHAPQHRHADGKIFVSSGSQRYNGQRCRKLRQLTPQDADFAAEWDKDVCKTVVELEDGTKAVVLHDEVRA